MRGEGTGGKAEKYRYSHGGHVIESVVELLADGLVLEFLSVQFVWVERTQQEEEEEDEEYRPGEDKVISRCRQMAGIRQESRGEMSEQEGKIRIQSEQLRSEQLCVA
ncbi:hypothetical protein chiPu_0027195 [Chiloscyllium punctatum]|uniref:Uncharacterized protein n=1 Tax=Chiloscyllium punctatum TaxID=137246 RepID=A0A401TKP1_CHIPU|nr:hypothetical protein [Chiloscyllium punctatum]